MSRRTVGIVLGMLFFIFLGSVNAEAQAVKQLRAKKDAETGLWGYENRGEQEYWWKRAHSQGKNENLMTGGYDTEWVISPQYDKVAKEFSENLAGVELNGKVGFVDKYNRFVICPQFEPVKRLDGFRFGLAAVKQGGKFGFINKKGEFVIPPMFDYAENFDNNMLATVKLDGKFGAVDFKGDTVVPCRYLAEEAMKYLPFKNKEYKETAEKVKVMYDEGVYEDLLKPVRSVAELINGRIKDSLWATIPDGKALVAKSSEGKTGIKSSENDSLWILKAEYDSIIPVHEGLFELVQGDFYGIADSYGRIVIPCHFSGISYQPTEQIFIVKRIYGITDPIVEVGLFGRSGAMILPPAFDSIAPFDDGKSVACLKGECGEIDVHGQVSDDYINRLIDAGNNGKGNYSFYKNLIAVRPDCARSHNNLGALLLENQDFKDGIQELKLAYKLDPDDELIAANYKQAKSERKQRRYQRVIKGLEVAGAVVGVASATYAAVSGETAVNTASSGFVSDETFSSETSSSGASSNYQMQYDKWERKAEGHYNSLTVTGGTITNKRGEKEGRTLQGMSESNYTAMEKSYREAQREMKNIRLKAKREGITIRQSVWETRPVKY